MPDAIKERLNELKALCEKYPIEIPLNEVAGYLHVKPESLRYAIMQGTCGFSALAWRKPGGKNASYSIQTLPFYLSQVNGVI